MEENQSQNSRKNLQGGTVLARSLWLPHSFMLSWLSYAAQGHIVGTVLPELCSPSSYINNQGTPPHIFQLLNLS